MSEAQPDLLELSKRELVNLAFEDLYGAQYDFAKITGYQIFRLDFLWRNFYIFRLFYLRSRVKKIIRDNRRDNRDELHRIVCVDFDYCRKAKEHGKKAQVVLALIDFILLFFSASGALILWAIQQGFFDELCECE